MPRYRASAGQGGQGGAYVVQGGMPEAHLPGSLDPAQAAIDNPTTITAGESPMPESLNGVRGGTQAAGAGVARPSAFTNTNVDNAAEHATPGQPNWRGTGDEPAGRVYGPYFSQEDPVPWQLTSDDQPADVGFELIDRARQGSTSDRDPGRPARSRFYDFILRPFDQLIAQHPGPVDRVYEPAPFAARPLQFAAPIPNAVAFNGTGAFGTDDGPGKNQAGPQLNTVRVLPMPWDEAVINTGGLTDQPDPGAYAQLGRGWRAR